MAGQRFKIFVAEIVFAVLFRSDCCASENQPRTEPTSHASINSFRDLQQMYFPREVEAQILGMKSPEEYVRIQTAFVQSMQKNQAWMQDYLKANADSVPLPYHKNFGITREEYERLLELTKQLKLVPVTKGRLKFSRISDDQIQIDGVDGLHEFDGTIIDFSQEHVVTRWGTAPLDRIVHVGDESVIGAWEGARCHLQTGSPESGDASLIRIDVGRQTASSLNFFCLSIRVVENGVKTASVEIPVLFP